MTISFATPLSVYGIPRTGFSLTLSTLYKLNIFNAEEVNILNILDRKLGDLLYKPILNFLEDELNNKLTLSGEFNSLTGGPKEIKNNKLWIRKYIGIQELGDITLSIKLPIFFATLMPIYHSHCIDDSISEKNTNIFTLRNPCGIYESSINSFNALTSEYLQKISPNLNQEESLRRELALYKVSSKKIRGSMINYLDKNMGDFVNSHIKFRSSIKTISWEGFLLKEDNNIKNFQTIIKKFGINKTTNEIKNILNEEKYKNLLKYHKHNYRPGHAMVSGWISELPDKVIDQIEKTKYFKKYTDLFENLFFQNSDLITFSLAESKFKKLSSSLINNNLVYEPVCDPILKEYALNKTNVSQDFFKDTHIVNKDCGSIYIHRMSKKCQNLINVINNYSKFLKEISEYLEDIFKINDTYNLYKNYPDLKDAISFSKDIFSETNKFLI